MLFGFCLVSCGTDDTPKPVTDPKPQKHLLSITSAKSFSDFVYDKNGRLVGWEYAEAGSAYSMSNAASAEYVYDGDVINIKAEDATDWGNGTAERWYFEESLHLGSNGMADYAEGTALLQRNTVELMKKKYICRFDYDFDGCLVSVGVEEWRTTSDGWVEETPLAYEIRLEWDGGRLVKVSDKNRESVYTYYYGDTGKTYMPLLGYPVHRSYYMPLRYGGVFGRQTYSLIKDIRTTFYDGSVSEVTYDYSFTTTSEMTFVTGYKSVLNETHESEYEVNWK